MIQATGFYNQATKTVVVVSGIFKENGTCWATYTNTIFEDGWYKFEVEGRSGADPDDMAYCCGFLEGYLAQKQIFDAFNLFIDSVFGNRSLPYPPEFIEYMTKNINFAFSNFASNKNYNVFLQMFDGLSTGYNQKADEVCSDGSCNQSIDRVLLWSYSSNGDLIDILPMLGIWKYSNHKRARCTAFIKLMPDYSDIFMSHNTWTDYRQLHAVMKKITLPIPFFNAHTVILSTRIGMIGSLDDFYVSDSNFMVFETSLLNMNETLMKSYVTPERLNYWIRANTAMFVAENGSHWVDLFIADNSGTYNNDYYVIDINKFTPGEKPTKDLVWLVEQVPSETVYKFDVTQNLTDKGYIVSFNVPFSEEIYDIMDYKSRANIDTLYVPYFQNCRYLISEREMPNVTTFDDFLQIGRYNKYKTDPVSKGNPYATIASRNELNTSETNDDYFEGALDNKVSRASEVFTRLSVHAINSPTNNEEVPIFTFNFDRLAKYPHDGLPTEFNFNYIEFGYNEQSGSYDKCINATNEKECFKIKFCGWCGETNQCLSGTASDGPLFGQKCPGDWRTKGKEGYTWVIIGGALAGLSVILLIIVIVYFSKKPSQYLDLDSKN